MNEQCLTKCQMAMFCQSTSEIAVNTFEQFDAETERQVAEVERQLTDKGVVALDIDAAVYGVRAAREQMSHNLEQLEEMQAITSEFLGDAVKFECPGPDFGVGSCPMQYAQSYEPAKQLYLGLADIFNIDHS